MSNALATLAVYKKKEDRGSLEVLSGWEGKWGDRDGMLAIATGSEVESSSLFFLLHVSLLLSLLKETSSV